MKLKRLFALALVLLMMAGLLTGCGGAQPSSEQSVTVKSEQGTASASDSAGAGLSNGTAAPDRAESTPSSPSKNPHSEAKLIITANLTLETTEFAKAQAGMDGLTKKYGGYYEKASTQSGSELGSSTKNASYTIRVPKDGYEKFLGEIGGFCHVVNKSQSAEDVGEVYVDTELRLKTQKTKQERLLALLAKAQKMEDIISLETALSDVQYQIEQYSSQLKRYDSLVDFATINASLQEVVKLSDIAAAQRGFFPRLGTAFIRGLKITGNIAQETVIVLAYCFPAIIFLVAGGAGYVIVIRRRRKAEEKKKQETDHKEE